MIKFIQYVVDTNVLINFLLSDLIEISEEEHYVLDIYNKTIVSNLLIPYFILTEFQVTLEKGIIKKLKLGKLESQKIKEESKKFMSNIKKYGSILEVENPIYSKSVELFSQLSKNQNLSLADVTLAVLTKTQSANLLTNDQELKKFYKELVI